MMNRPLKRSRVCFALLAALPSAAVLSAAGVQPWDDDREAGYIMGYTHRVEGEALPLPQTPQKADDGADAKKAKAVEALGESPLAAVFSAIGPDARLYAQHNITLSNPFMEGRVPGSNGNRIAADYIEFWFRKYGLTPAFASAKAPDGADPAAHASPFRQPFRHGSTLAATTQTVTLHPSGREDMKLIPGKDFTVLNMSGSGKIKGDVVFCGYGIDGPNGYKTFDADSDLSGKIALVMRFEPMDENGMSKWAERGWSPAASLDAKIQNVARCKPAAIMLVNPPGAADPRAKDLIPFDPAAPEGDAVKMPVIMITTEAADRLGSFNGTLMDYRVRSDDSALIFKLVDSRASIDIAVGREPVMTDNVGAVLPGRGTLANEYIVVGAHYDHVGYGMFGAEPSNRGKLHPGADDNASGTSGVLLLAGKLAESYAKLPEGKPARSIFFLTFSAEESGLNGSIYFVEHPSVDLSKVYFMLNMDMIGRLRAAPNDPKYKDHGLDVEGTESAEGFYDVVKPFFDASGIEIKHGASIASNSDHWSFYSKQVPILNFFTGYHSDYHKPADTFDLINQVGAAKIVAMAHDITLSLAQRPEPLKFTTKKRETKAAAKTPAKAAGTGGVRFGIKPESYDEDTKGIGVAEVFDGTSAADAGIKAGDTMVKWNGKPLTDVATWMPLIQSAKVGDVVDVTVVRDGKEQVIKVKLKGREEGDR